MDAATQERTKLVGLAKKCLSSPGTMELLKIHQFDDDSEAHNEERQKSLEEEFEAGFSETVHVLEQEFGQARIAKSEQDVEGIPLCGVFSAAFWQVPSG